MIHDLAALLGRLPSGIADGFDPEVTTLTVFAVGQRYPAPSWDPMTQQDTVEEADAVSAVDLARQFLAQVRSIVDRAKSGTP